MRSSFLHRTIAVTTIGLLALAGTAAAEPDDNGSGEPIVTAAQLPVDVLQDVLPITAEDAGFDFAPRLLKVFGSQSQRSFLASSGLDVTEHGGHDYVELVAHSQDDLDFLDELGARYEVTTPDLIALESERILADAAFAAATDISSLPSGRDMYRVVGDFETEIDQLVADNPELAKKVIVGQSVEGADIVGIEIGVDVNEPEDGRPVLLMFGVHHAREWPSAEAPMEFAHDLMQTFTAGDARTVDLLTRARALIVPVSNPDGYDISRTQGDLIDLNVLGSDGDVGTVVILATPGGAYKRKNCRIVDGQSQPPGPCAALASGDAGGFGPGIDLNRNYGALWGGPGANGATDGTGGLVSPVYRGPAPFSEPETAAIRELISTRQVTTLISNHTFSNLLLRPVGVVPTTVGPDGFPIGFAPDECFTTASGDDLGMQTLGEKMTAQVGYSNQFGWELYDTTGTTEDYSYNATGGYGYTFEIGPDEFHPPYEEFIGEYIGSTEAADAVTTETAPELTTSTARDCAGDDHEHDVVGGGLREAYFIALENAADTATHSVITGKAPAGAEIGVTRTGTFPLWDGTPFEDTVSTTMTVPTADVTAAAAGGGVPFTYDVNPSTRPFNDSRAYRTFEQIVEARQVQDTIEDSTPTNPVTPTRIEIELDDSVQWFRSETIVPDTEDVDVTLFAPDATPIATSGDFIGADEIIDLDRAPGAFTPGTYVLEIAYFAGGGVHDTTITFGDYAGGDLPPLTDTPRTPEQWTLTCTLGGDVIDTRDVSVDRGQSVDVGELCVVAATAESPAPAPAPDSEDGELAATGGGAAALALGLLALGGFALAGRRRDELG